MKVERDEILEVLFENYIDTQVKVIMKEDGWVLITGQRQ